MTAGKHESNAEIRIGISRCLLGDEVRFDGGHKHDGFITGTLGQYFTWVPVCPEWEAGLGVPRESVRLVKQKDNLRMLGVRTGTDVTDAMNHLITRRIPELAHSNLHGFIFKKDSPSCGFQRVKVYGEPGLLHKQGQGLFAAAVMETWPLLPAEDEGRLNDPALRENFIERVFSYFRWSRFLASKPKPKDLVQFHTTQKLAVLSHSTTGYQELGRLVAGSGKAEWNALLAGYGQIYMETLKLKATRRKHSNVLFHLMGYLKNHIDAQDKTELAECIEEYRKEHIPLIVPMTLLMHHFRRHPHPWVTQQTYLNPYPSEMMLRNHV